MAWFLRRAWIGGAAILLLVLFALDPWDRDANRQEGHAEIASSAGRPEEARPGSFAAAPVLEPSLEEGTRNELAVSQAARTVFGIREQDGAAIAGARVFLCREERLLSESKADAEGRIEVESDGGEANLTVSTRERPLHPQSVRLVPGRQTIVLPAGGRLAGTVRFADRSAAAEVTLILRSDHPLLELSSIPGIVWKTLEVEPAYYTLSTRTHAEGGFRFRGLPDAWSGSIRVSGGPTLLESTNGEIGPGRTTIRLEAAVEDLDLVLAEPRRIHGRLVASPSLEPLAEVEVSALSTPRDGATPNFTSTTTESYGGFALRLDPAEIGTLELHLGARYHEGVAISRLESGELPADGALGTIEVPSLRDIRFLLLDGLGAPIPGGIAGAAGIFSTPSDAEGNGVLHWVPPTARRMRVVADGFVPTERDLVEFAPDPLVIVLERGNRLAVRIRPPAGGDVSQFRALLSHDALLIRGPAADDFELRDYVREWSYPPPGFAPAGFGSALIGSPDADGMVLFRSLVPGVELDLEIRGITGAAVYHHERLAPLGVTEDRHHEVALGASLRAFRGRVTDLAGNPLVRATVQLGGQILGWTDPAGEFSCFTVEEDPKTLVVAHRSAATLFLKDYVIPLDGAPVELRLEPALRVVVEVVDEAGKPVPDAVVYVLRGGFTSTTHALGDGRFETGGMSSDLVRIQTRVAGRIYLQEHDPAQPKARVVVPLHGSLTVELAAPPPAREGDYRVVLQARDAEVYLVQSAAITAAGGWRCTFPFVLPSTYLAELHYSPTQAEQAAGEEPATIAASQAVRVAPGADTEIRLAVGPG